MANPADAVQQRTEVLKNTTRGAVVACYKRTAGWYK